jgi:hypothetical protein
LDPALVAVNSLFAAVNLHLDVPRSQDGLTYRVVLCFGVLWRVVPSRQYVSQMEAAGFFKADVLPKMVEQSLSQIE